MGVRGLSSFIDYNPTLSKDHKLHDCQIIIDGNNLVHYLYFNHKLDCICGGDYYRFAQVIKKHISLFLACNVKPIVLFDGAYDASDRKLATILQRTKQRLTNAQHIAKYGCCSGKVLPILAVEIMKTVLRNLDITVIQSDYEADEDLMLLANRHNCPVVSQDSDFYIFDIIGGFIRLDSIGSEVLQGIDETDREFKYLKCKIYQIDHFVSVFPGMNKSLLPLFSTLIGNDFAHINTFDEFYSNIQLPKFKGRLKVSQRHKRMLGLLNWLQYRTIEDAIEQVLNHVKLKKRDQVRTIINDSMKSYHGQSLNVDDTEDADCLQSNFKTFQEKSLPAWFIKDMRCGMISSFLLNTIALHRNFLPSQVEDMSLKSSFICSRYIRQILYSILLNYDLDDSSCGNYVDEYDRRNGNLQKEPLQVLCDIEGYGEVPGLKHLNTLDISHRMNIMLIALGDDLEYYSTIPPRFQLLFGGIRYWLRNCHPKPPEEVFIAFIISAIFLGVVPSIIAAGTKEHTFTYFDNTDLENVIANIEYTDAMVFNTNMKKYFHQPQQNNASAIIFRYIHHFCQLQSCALFLTYLNKLLHNPFVNINLTECFNGTVFYNLSRRLMSKCSSELFIVNLLSRGSNLEILYRAMKNKILQNMPENSLTLDDCHRNIGKTKSKCSKVKESSLATLPVSECVDLDIQILADSDVDVFL